MTSDKRKRLDEENKARIGELDIKFYKGEMINDEEIFLSKAIMKSIESPKVIISYDIEKILLNYPFSPEIYTTICPHCECVSDSKTLRILLDNRAITPILYAPYSEYPEDFVDVILNYPHMGLYEFDFYRNTRLVSDAERQICTHCIRKKHEAINGVLEKKGYKPFVREIVGVFMRNLSPYIGSDGGVIEEFENALKRDDDKLVDQIFNLSWAIRDTRTIRVYNARSNMPADALPGLLKETGESIERISETELLELYTAMSRVVKVTIPKDVPMERYITIVGPYRKELNRIVEDVLKSGMDDRGVSISKIRAKIGEINEQLLSLEKKKRFLSYKASVSFLKGNKALVASSLLAGLMGLTGNFIGCGVSVASGIGAEILKRKKKVKLPKEFKKLSEEIGNSVRPYINRIIAGSLQLNFNAVQLWDIREKISSKSKK